MDYDAALNKGIATGGIWIRCIDEKDRDHMVLEETKQLGDGIRSSTLAELLALLRATETLTHIMCETLGLPWPVLRPDHIGHMVVVPASSVTMGS